MPASRLKKLMMLVIVTVMALSSGEASYTSPKTEQTTAQPVLEMMTGTASHTPD